MKFGSVCSGIEAASVAWHPLGWSAAWLAEIEPFPSAVLQHHYPCVPNLGDMTQIAHLVRDGFVEAPDILVGGTPCQSFSIAGLRNSMSDARGQLTLSFVDLANAIDTTRFLRDESAAIIVWENVPGVLNTPDNAFGCFLGALAGEDSELQPTGGRGEWSNAGCVFGPQRAIAWRVIDAQYFGVAQRRRRVFVVASARDGFDPSRILFEFEGVRRDIAPRRGEKEEITSCFGVGINNCGEFNPEIARTLLDKPNDSIAYDIDTYLTSTFDRQSNCEYGIAPIASTVSARDYKSASDLITYSLAGNTIGRKPVNGGNGTGYDDSGVSYTLTKTDRHAVCAPRLIGAFKGGQGAKAGGVGFNDNVSPTLSAADSGSNRVPVIAFDSRQDCVSSTRIFGALGSSSPQAQAVATHMQVRRLTPVECARLQGFPDTYLDIQFKNKPAANSHKYKALGNSMAVPCMEWIGNRIKDYMKENL